MVAVNQHIPLPPPERLDEPVHLRHVGRDVQSFCDADVYAQPGGGRQALVGGNP